MLRDIKKLRLLMDKKQKRQMAWLVVMMIIAGFLETVSISLVILVVSAVMQPDLLETNALVSDVCEVLHIGSRIQFTVISMIALIVIFIAKDAFLFGNINRSTILSIRISFRRRNVCSGAM